MKRFFGKSGIEYGNVNPTRFASSFVVACVLLFALAMIAGCASQSSPSADSAEPEQASGEVAEQEGGSTDDSDSSENAQEATEEKSDSAPVDPSDADIALYDEWADTTVCDALNNLADEGVIAQPPSDAEYLGEAFEYSNNDIAFLDEEAGEELSGSYSLPAGKVIIGSFDSIVSESAHSTIVFYADGTWGSNEDGELTLFYPESMFGYFDMYQMHDALTDVPIDAFANSIDECDYLIVFDGVTSEVEEDFYMGGWDRETTTTLALIIDAKQGKIVHIENVGSDTPPSMQADSTAGEMLRSELAEYLHDLLLEQSGN